MEGEYEHSPLSLCQLVVLAAIEYLKSHPVDPINASEFESACGVGVTISIEEIEKHVSEGKGRGREIAIVFFLAKVAELIEAHKTGIEALRYRFNPGVLLGE